MKNKNVLGLVLVCRHEILNACKMMFLCREPLNMPIPSPLRSQEDGISQQLLLTGGAAAEFEKMSGLSGIKRTPLCMGKDEIDLKELCSVTVNT